MIKLDDDLLKELGLGNLPPEEKKKLLAHIYETLEMRVGMKLAQQMSEAQLREFESFINTNDEAGALRWLEENFPNYKDVVAAEFDILKKEIQQAAPQILAASQQAPVGPQQPPATGFSPSSTVPPTANPWQQPWPSAQPPAQTGNQGQWSTQPNQPPYNTQYYNTPPTTPPSSTDPPR